MEKLSLKETILLKKLQNIQDELHIVRTEMEFLRIYPEDTQQKVIPSPCSEMKQIGTNPVQTVAGKDSTNPLKAGSSPTTTTEVQTSTTLETTLELLLKPNGGIQIPNKTEGQTSAVPNRFKGPKAYYVVFNGPNAGIYTTWDIAEKAVKGFSGIKHKKYKSFTEAKVAAGIYTTQEFKPPLELISSAEALQPTYKGALTKEKTSSKIVLGSLPKNQQTTLIQTDEDTDDIRYSEFKYLYQFGRLATEKEFVEEHFFTTDKKNVSYFNFYPNANPEMVYEAYQYGILAQVYPSNNLLEIAKFPKEFRDTVKTYKKKCLKNQDIGIFIKTTSTIICWENEEEYDCPANQPFHYVQVGTVKEKVYSPSQVMEATLEKQDLREMAENKLLILINKLFSIQKEDKLKVNLATTHVLITSYSHKGLSEEDYNKVVAFRQQLLHKDAVGAHKEIFCSKKQKETEKFGINLNCQICGPDKAAGKQIMETPEIGILYKATAGKRF
ncbi:Transactivator/viroplasmin protein [Heracleum sosnowskyi]|uniref:Transactivator/viroplasmin protein n=1 Tax=Heracleum sosnowskyi TaxID=360622 RepID=A0AAD8INV1_9APIA|nr:Transactivator/viroplasmin protein [Heracleum sosnowskyi]